eukprot:514839_1
MCWLKYLRETVTLTLSENVKFDLTLKRMDANDEIIGKSFEMVDKNNLKSLGFEILSDRQIFDKIQELMLRELRQKSCDENGKINTMESRYTSRYEFKCPI